MGNISGVVGPYFKLSLLYRMYRSPKGATPLPSRMEFMDYQCPTRTTFTEKYEIYHPALSQC